MAASLAIVKGAGDEGHHWGRGGRDRSQHARSSLAEGATASTHCHRAMTHACLLSGRWQSSTAISHTHAYYQVGGTGISMKCWFALVSHFPGSTGSYWCHLWRNYWFFPLELRLGLGSLKVTIQATEMLCSEQWAGFTARLFVSIIKHARVGNLLSSFCTLWRLAFVIEENAMCEIYCLPKYPLACSVRLPMYQWVLACLLCVTAVVPLFFFK